MGRIAGCLVLISIGVGLAAPAVAAERKPHVEVIFKGRTPDAVARRLSAECTRRLMALVRNTPEQVVCKHRSRFTRQWPDRTANELWSFDLTAEDKSRTKVVGHAAFEAASPRGYAVVSFVEQIGDERAAMRAFLRDVRDLGELRGRFMLRPQPAD